MISIIRVWVRPYWGRLVLVFIPGLLIAPFALLYLLAFIFWITEAPLADVDRVVYRQPNGASLVSYWHRLDDAKITVIFVHGTPATGTAFRHQMDYPFPDADRVTYDRPGFGQSPGSVQEANLTYQSETLIELIKHVPTTRVVLVGHSYGGPIVLKVSALIPERVAGVAMIGGSVSPQEEHPWTIQYVGAWSFISPLLPSPVRSCNEELLKLKTDLTALNQQLSQVECPVLMLQGMRDEQVPPANVTYLKGRFAALNKSTLIQDTIFPNYNHFMMWEHPEETNQALNLFVARCLGKPESSSLRELSR